MNDTDFLNLRLYFRNSLAIGPTNRIRLIGECRMRRLVYLGLAVLATAVGCVQVPVAELYSPEELFGPRDFHGSLTAPGGPKVPAGALQRHIGQYMTIEGEKYTKGKVGERCLAVDTINGKRLATPIGITIQNLDLPKKGRYVLKGYETGEMIGTPPAEIEAAKEQGKKVGVTAAWQWHPEFVVLRVVGPKELKLPDPLAPSDVSTAPDPAVSGTVGALRAPLVPPGVLGGDVGQYVTIEGVQSDGVRCGSQTLQIDTINGRKLEKPSSIWVKNLLLPPNERCVLKGYETGKMIGAPPAENDARKEQGKDPQYTSACWQWQPEFVALIVVEPKGLKLPEK